MTRIVLNYFASDGSVSTRTITDWIPNGEGAIEAYCQLRKERRTFKIMNMLSVVDEQSGEQQKNLWRTFGLERSSDGREKIEAILGERLMAIRVLKFYSISTRGFAKRERDHLLNYALQGITSIGYSREDVDSWLQSLWAGDVNAYAAGDDAEYKLMLSFLPSIQVPGVRITAELIARGSGRRALSPDAAERIARDFAVTRTQEAPPS